MDTLLRLSEVCGNRVAWLFALLIVGGADEVYGGTGGHRSPDLPSVNRADSMTVENLKKLIAGDPRADANRAFERGDFRFLGVSGFLFEVPGVAREHYERFGVREIGGTSDVVAHPNDIQLQQAVKKYAESYNKRLLQRIGKTKAP